MTDGYHYNALVATHSLRYMIYVCMYICIYVPLLKDITAIFKLFHEKH